MIKHSLLFGGKAGQGPNILAFVIAKALVSRGYYVFNYRDYPSLIRGGHNFNLITFSDEPINSNESKYDVIVALDENTEKIHSPNLKENSFVLKGKNENMYYAGSLFKLLGIEFKELDDELKALKRRYEENIKLAKAGYDGEKRNLCELKNLCKVPGKKENVHLLDGSQGVAEGAIKSGLDLYYAYPMTPSTGVLRELAGKQEKGKFLTLELENEIAVINAAVGSAVTGAKTMVGTSGGGFDLMAETMSLIGIGEIPMVIYLAQRHGPATGAATYTGQEDLNTARHTGHGEFPKVVLAPGDPIEAEELTSHAFYFSQKYKIPAIIASDKHLAESIYTVEGESKIKPSQKLTTLRKFNSKEMDENFVASAKAEVIEKNTIKRLKTSWTIEKEADEFPQYKVYGKKDSKNVVVSWGSTKGAILDSIKDLDVKFIQILYIDPFPKKVAKELKGNLILVENNSTALLASLISEKIGIFFEDKNKILRFDGRPFLHDELKEQIKRRI